MKKMRNDNELPKATDKWGWKFHHIGIPTKERKENEKYITELKFYVSGFDTSPFGIEWMRFENDSPIDSLIQNVAHIAFEVEDLSYELQKHNFKIITAPTQPSEGVKIAMIEHNGAPIELLEFSSDVVSS